MKIKTYYHATPYTNLDSIKKKGVLVGSDNLVYLTNSPETAARFCYIRGCSDILVVSVSLEEDFVTESYDHSESFFKCRAYTYPKNIRPYRIKELIRYQV